MENGRLIYKEESKLCGIHSNPDSLTREERINIIFNNLELLMENVDYIKTHPEMDLYNPQSFCFGGSLVGGIYLNLGPMLEIWSNDKLTCECDDCKGKSYIYRLGGFMSGRIAEFLIYCPNCGEIKNHEFSGTFGEYFKIVRESVKGFNRMNTYTELQIRETPVDFINGKRYDRKLSSYSYEILIEPPVKTMDLESIISKLKEINSKEK